VAYNPKSALPVRGRLFETDPGIRAVMQAVDRSATSGKARRGF